jgi:RNA polymerase sigma-70 factor, ECF subfamily
MTPDSALDDLVLIERLLDRDQQALTILYDRYSGAVFNMAFYVLQNRVAAEEITQDVFFLLWRTPGKWQPDKGRLGSWLVAVTRYTAIDRLRREKRKPESNALSLETLAHKLNERVSATAAEDADLMRSVLRQLPKEQAEVILLAYYRGMSHEEIAAHLKIPPGTVKSRIRLGLAKLRDLWREAVREP